jgi:hypothetical protein
MDNFDTADKESIRDAMDLAWSDHQHTRDQTWKALHMEFLLILGVVGANWFMNSNLISIVSIIFVCLVVLCGIQITIRHRNRVELTKFRHIINCEEALGLHRYHLISGVTMPLRIKFWDAFNPKKGNTALFILRMHIAIMGFALFLLVYRLFSL